MEESSHGYSNPLPAWEQHFDHLTQRLAPRFARVEGRQQATAYLQGLLSPIERKNGWQLAEPLGHTAPHRVQHLLDRALWEEAVRSDLRAYVGETLADPLVWRRSQGTAPL